MKAWQNGVELDTLKEYVAFYDKHHNQLSFSPFVQVNKRTVADMIGKNNLIAVVDNDNNLNFSYSMKTFKAKSAIKSFGIPVAHKLKDDVEISKINYLKDDEQSVAHLTALLNTYANSPIRVWLYIFEEDTFLKELAVEKGFHKVTSQYKSTAEIIGVYCNHAQEDKVPEYDKTTLIRVDYNRTDEFDDALAHFQVKLDDLQHNFANHYSNYNKGNTWSALSLRGYSDDVSFIEKPEEVMKSKKWADKYKDKEFKLQNTELWDYFKEELQTFIIACFNNPVSSAIDVTFDRVRLMQLEPGGGELLRHSDLQDPDVGTADGKTMRFHIPIFTNDRVDFSAWDWNGDKQTENFKEGELFYLDQRKPHTVVNNGDTNRIHLVFDVIANEHARGLISGL